MHRTMYAAYLCKRLLGKVRLTLQKYSTNYTLLPVETYLGTEVWNGIWKEILVWNGRFLVWNGRKLPVWNMEKSSSIPYHVLVVGSNELLK